MIRFLSICSLAALTVFITHTPRVAAAPARAATVVLVFSAADPVSALPDVRTMDVALRAPFEVGAVVKALDEHPTAHIALELTPNYVTSLKAAEANPLAAAAAVLDSTGDDRTHDVLALLAQLPPMDAGIAASPGGRALAAYAARAQSAIGGASAHRMLRSDIQRAAAFAAAARLAMAGSSAARALMDAPPPQLGALLTKAGALLANSAAQSATGLASAAHAGSLEIVATPAGDPVLPILVDSGGKSASDPTAIPLDASADAAALIADALASAAALNGNGRAGIASPYGAYDDAAAQTMAAHNARFAIFSDRVVQASQAGGSVAALAAALGAPYQSYALQISKTATMPVLFWDDASSRALESIAATSPSDAFANRLISAAQTASSAAAGTQALIAVRVRLDRQWAQRADAEVVVGDVARVLGARNASATPTQYIVAHPKAPAVYGFAPGSSLGSLDAFDGSPNQQAMWSALAAARYAASNGGGAVSNTNARTLLWRAEAGSWYRVPDLPLSGDTVTAQLDRFRALIAGIYRSCGKTPPAKIAPQRTPSPSPSAASPTPSEATPSPSPSAKLSTGPVNMWRTSV